MQTYIALIKRELLEHRGAFLYAPAVLLVALFGLLVVGIIFGDTQVSHTPDHQLVGTRLYQMGLGATFGLWSVYLMAALFFYYADSFSADARNNAMLFWKSLPQSDLKILTSKALAGITIFPLLLFGFALISGFLLYLLGFLVATKWSYVPLIGPIDMVSSLVQMGIAGLVYFVLTILWYAPFFAWVAGLSTLFRRWSIPLAFLIPGVVVLVEFLTNIGGGYASRPIANFLAYRGESLLEDETLFKRVLANPDFSPMDLIAAMFSAVSWSDMAIGIAFTATIIYLASEYRRRRIDA